MEAELEELMGVLGEPVHRCQDLLTDPYLSLSVPRGRRERLARSPQHFWLTFAAVAINSLLRNPPCKAVVFSQTSSLFIEAKLEELMGLVWGSWVLRCQDLHTDP